MNDTAIQEIVEAVRDGGHRFRAVAEGLAYLWKRGKLAKLGEALIDIKTELIRDAFCKEAAREMFVRLLTKSTIGAPGTMEPDELERLKTTCPELAEIADSWAARRLSKSERDHFAAMWPRTSEMLVGYARKFLKNENDAMDCVAEVAAHMLQPKVFRLMEGDRSEVKFRQFATHCTRYEIGNRLAQRKQKHLAKPRRFVSEAPLEPNPSHRTFCRMPSRKHPLTGRESSVVNRVLEHEREQGVHECLDELSPRHRQVAWIHFALGETMERTAEMSGLTYSVVVGAKYKVRDLLKELIPEWLRPEYRETFEESVLRLYRNGGTSFGIANRLGCSKPHVRDILRKHNLETDRRTTASRSWTSREDALLRSLPPAEAAEQTGRTIRAIYTRREKIGLSRAE